MSELPLKNYQQLTLDALRDYFKACERLDSAVDAFSEVLRDEETPLALAPYHSPIEELKDLPYVCLRLPTGAGKTLLASHAPSVALRHLLHREHCMVLWLVTSETIRAQTLAALKDREHPYRIALERGVGSVTILDIEQAIGINRARLDGDTVVIVATIQSFRRDKPEWLRVHRDASASMDVFERWESAPDNVKIRLEMLQGGDRPLYSLANALCLHRPVVIVDEAHNANTPLSFDTLAKVYPSCIIEFTATPKKGKSNILHSVSAAELDAEEMIKMPIRLETRPQWKELLADAIGTRDRLETLANRERAEHGGEYLRPVMLLQAQRKNEELTVDTLFECLKTDYRIPEDQIAIATGARDTLADQNVMSPDCPLRFIITVDKLREGWDCPFAYVLATVREMRSSTAIEQILGRVMRLPNARKKTIDDLNRAYAFSVSDHIGAALGSLRESLVEIGFEKMAVKDMVVAAPQQDNLFGFEGIGECPAVSVVVPEVLDVQGLSEEAQAVVRYEEATRTIEASAPLTESVVRELEAVYTTPEGRNAVRSLNTASQKLERRRAPVDNGIRFDVPMLCYRQGDLLEPFEDSHFCDHLWPLSKYSPTLSEAEFSTLRPSVETGEVYQKDGRLLTQFVSQLQEQMERLSNDRGWTNARLAQWLDFSIPHRDISPQETGIFLVNAIEHLTAERGIDLANLLYEKYRLRDALEKKIDHHRRSARGEAFQTLFTDDSLLVVEPRNPLALFTYTRSAFSYGTSNPYLGNHVFLKHYFARIFDLKADGEEFECACFIDSLPQVEFWVRNIERRPESSFWFQTSSDRFYPDFVCKLRDSRVLVVEFKGGDRWSNDDSREKRSIGELWEERSEGNCHFIMPNGKDFGAISAKIA